MGDLGSTLGWEDPLEEGMVTHSSILARIIPADRGAWWATVHGVTYSPWGRKESDTTQHSTCMYLAVPRLSCGTWGLQSSL